MIAGQSADIAEQLFQQALSAQSEGRFTDAEETYRQAIAADPLRSAPQNNLAVLLRGLGRLEDARDLLQQVLAREPDLATSRYALGLVLMGMGDYPAGWPLYESRRQIPALKIQTPVLPFSEWRGGPVDGKRIVIFPEQGLGDNIQFARFALTLRDQGADVLLLSPPALAGLFAHALERVEVRAAAGEINLGEPDGWVLAGSLPGRLGVTPQTVASAPYLKAPAPLARSGPRFRVGLATRGNPALANDSRRSLQPLQAEQLVQRLQALDLDIVSLHPEHAGDMISTANLIAGLDLVVSVDSAMGHLAGALGKPVFLLLPGFATDWRWMRDRNDSPWYEAHRLFRNRLDGDWNSTFDAVVAAVRDLARADGAG